MVKRFKDITFQRFNSLVAVHFRGKNKHNKAVWTFLCDCGEKKDLVMNTVTQGNTKSCGCLNKKSLESRSEKYRQKRLAYIGKTYGHLTCLSEVEGTIFEFACSCGNTCHKELTVIHNKQPSCGCKDREGLNKSKEDKRNELIGGVYNELHVESICDHTDVHGKALYNTTCSCGERYETPRASLLNNINTCPHFKIQKFYGPDETLRCQKCLECLPPDQFCKDKHSFTGKKTHCKSCVAVQKKRTRVATKQRNLVTTTSVDYKICKSCNTELPITSFHKDLYTADGFKSKCQDCCAETFLEKYWEDPEKYKAYSKKGRERNPSLSANARRIRTHNMKNARVEWADKDTIKDFYKEARYFGLQVDHIVPITHSLVCGLHNEFNLQLLTQVSNNKKSNKFDPNSFTHEIPPTEECLYGECV